jgi:hypothetical protein
MVVQDSTGQYKIVQNNTGGQEEENNTLHVDRTVIKDGEFYQRIGKMSPSQNVATGGRAFQKRN